jgi:hypothetical protein
MLGLMAGTLVGLGGGCYTAPFKPPQGVIFTQVKAPLMVNQKHTPVAQTSGSASSSSFHLWYVDLAWDDCSIDKAAKAGGITNVQYADYEFFSVLGVYTRMTVTAYGDKAAVKPAE